MKWREDVPYPRHSVENRIYDFVIMILRLCNRAEGSELVRTAAYLATIRRL